MRGHPNLRSGLLKQCACGRIVLRHSWAVVVGHGVARVRTGFFGACRRRTPKGHGEDPTGSVAYTVMAQIVMTYIVMTYTVMVYIVMALYSHGLHRVIAYIGMVYIVMAYTVMV